MKPVTLNRIELLHAGICGVQRHIQAIFEGLENQHDAKSGPKKDNGWTLHVEGAAGELAVAKVCNKYYDFSVGKFRRGGDVGKAQVRTRWSNERDLLIRKNARDEDYYVLVTGLAPVFQVWGYIQAKDAKRPEWLHAYADREEAYFVPKDALTPL